MNAREPTVTIITPARYAAGTLPATLENVRKQCLPHYEHIVILDGADGETERIAESAARKDRSVILLRQQQGGAASARNTGLLAARGDWVIFLDADDLLGRGQLKAMLAAGKHADVVGCGYRRVSSGGELTSRHKAYDPGRDERAIAFSPPGAIHAFLTRRTLLLAAGPFDATLVTNEDWDLWLRVFALRPRYTPIASVSPVYRISAGSLTSRGDAMIRDTARVRARARLVFGDRGLADAELQLRSVFWNGAIGIGNRRNVQKLIDHVTPLPSLPVEPASLIASMLEGLSIGLDTPINNLVLVWPEIASALEVFIEQCCDRAGQACLAGSLVRGLEYEAIRAGSFFQSRQVGRTYALVLRPALLWSGFSPPVEAEVVVVTVPILRPRSACTVSMPASVLSGPDVVQFLLASLFRIATHPFKQRVA